MCALYFLLIYISHLLSYDNSFWWTKKKKQPVLQISIISKSKVGDGSRGWPEGSLFNSCCAEVYGRALHLLLDCSTLPSVRILIMLSVRQGVIKYNFLSLCHDPTWDWTPISRIHASIYLCPTVHLPWNVLIFWVLNLGRIPCSEMVKVLGCDLEVSEFGPLLHDYIHFRVNTLALNRIITVFLRGWI